MTGELMHTAEMALHKYINYCLKSEVAIMLCCQLCSTTCTNLSVIKLSQCEKNGKISATERKQSCATTESTLFTVSKDE